MRTLGILVFASACGFGGGSGTEPDAEAATADAAPGATTIEISDRGRPQAGVSVFFQGPDSALIAATATDVNGTVGAVVPAGSFVTVLDGDELVTFSDVQPGDALRLERNPTGSVEISNVTVNAEAAMGSVGLLYTSCGGPFAIAPQTPTPVQLIGCGTMASLLVASVDEDSGLLAQSIYDPEVRIEEGKLSTVQGQAVGVDDTTLAYSNVPTPWQTIESYRALIGPHGVVYDATAAVVRPATEVTLQNPVAPGTSALVVTTGTVAATELGQQLVHDYIANAGPADQTPIDLGPGVLRRYREPARFDVAGHRLAWSEDGVGQVADLVRVGLVITRRVDPYPRTWRWQLVGRHDNAAVRFPVLPDAIASLDPIAGDIVAVSEQTSIWFQDKDLLERYRTHSYDSLRTAGVAPVEVSTRIVEQKLAFHEPLGEPD